MHEHTLSFEDYSPPSVYLGKYWCYSHDKWYQAFPLCSCILQAIKNWMVGGLVTKLWSTNWSPYQYHWLPSYHCHSNRNMVNVDTPQTQWGDLNWSHSSGQSATLLLSFDQDPCHLSLPLCELSFSSSAALAHITIMWCIKSCWINTCVLFKVLRSCKSCRRVCDKHHNGRIKG